MSGMLATTATAALFFSVDLAGENIFDGHIENDLAVGDLTQAGNDLFVGRSQERLGIFLAELDRTLRSEVDQRESVGSKLKAIFYCYACHLGSVLGASA